MKATSDLTLSLVLIVLALVALFAQIWLEDKCARIVTNNGDELPKWLAPLGWVSAIVTPIALGVSAARLTVPADNPNLLGTAIITSALALVALAAGLTAARVVRHVPLANRWGWLLTVAYLLAAGCTVASAWVDLAPYQG